MFAASDIILASIIMIILKLSYPSEYFSRPNKGSKDDPPFQFGNDDDADLLLNEIGGDDIGIGGSMDIGIGEL